MKQKEYSLAIHWNYIGISLVFFTIFTLLVLYLPTMREIDYTILKSVRLALSPFPSYIPLFFSEFGMANNLLWPQIAACCTLISHRYFLKAFMLVLFTQLSLLAKELIKNYVCRIRPETCGGEQGFSFPSGRATVVMCFLGIIIYLIHYYVRSDFWRNLLIFFFSLWIIITGISRLWLGSHFPSDVICGWLLGFIFVNLYIILDKAISR